MLSLSFHEEAVLGREEGASLRLGRRRLALGLGPLEILLNYFFSLDKFEH